MGVVALIYRFLCVVALNIYGAILCIAAESRVDAPTVVYVLPDTLVVTEIDDQGTEFRPEVKLAENIFNYINMDLEVQAVPVPRMYRYLKNGTANFSILIDTPKARACCYLSDDPVYRLELGIYQKPDVKPVNNIEDMKGKHFITIRGYSYGALGPFIRDKKNGVVTFPAPTHENAFDMLEAGRADYLLTYRGPATRVLEAKEKHNIKYSILKSLDLFLVLRKDYPQAKKLIQQLEAIIQQLPKDAIGNPCVDCFEGLELSD